MYCIKPGICTASIGMYVFRVVLLSLFFYFSFMILASSLMMMSMPMMTILWVSKNNCDLLVLMEGSTNTASKFFAPLAWSLLVITFITNLPMVNPIVLLWLVVGHTKRKFTEIIKSAGKSKSFSYRIAPKAEKRIPKIYHKDN